MVRAPIIATLIAVLWTPAYADSLIHGNRETKIYTATPLTTPLAKTSTSKSDKESSENQEDYSDSEIDTITHSISANALWRPRPGLHPATPSCVLHAVAIHHLSLAVVIALMRTEGGHPGTDHINTDKVRSHDLGVMQVNDHTWLKTIADHDMNGDLSATYKALRDDGCYNVMWGTEIFSRYVDEAQGRYWLAVGYYNSHTIGPRMRYTAVVVKKFMDILNTLNRTKVISDTTAQSYADQARAHTFR